MEKVNKIKIASLIMLSALFFLSSCNKDLEQFAPIATPTYPGGSGVAATIAANPSDSMYYKLLVRSGLVSTLNDSTKSFTLFATDNTGMKIFVNAASGGLIPLNAPDAAFVSFINSSLPVASAAGIVQYNTIGQKFPSASIGTAFPNYPLPSQIILDPTQPFVRMPIFPVRGTPYSYVNNIPITAVDQAAANGVIHHTFTIVAPPSATLKTMIAAEPTLSYFRAAIARADSGAVGLNKLDSLLNYGVTNMTVLIPNDAAMQAFLTAAITGALIAQGVPPATAAAQAAVLASTPAVFSNPALYGAFSAATVKGILAYHFLATNSSGSYTPNIRVFSNNFPASNTFIKTLVNGGVPAHPGVSCQAIYTGPAVTTLRFIGLGTFPPGGPAYSGTPATAVTMDKHAVNGVYHIINGVLLPQ